MLINLGYLGLALTKAMGVYGPYPAPSGYRWSYIFEDGNQVTENGIRVVELQRAA